MTATNTDDARHYEESDADRRRSLLGDQGVTLDLASALVGDRPLTEATTHRLDHLKKSRGPQFYSDLLYAISHEFFSPDIAEELWARVVRHKHHLTSVLGRNMGIAVAALDFLSNITGNMRCATLIGERHMREIVGLSLRDGLTGLFNHTYFEQQIDLEVSRYVRYGSPVSLVLIDIDDFKEVNDRFGHQEGDRVLRSMGRIIGRLARAADISCRFGGEEFAIILRLTDIREAGVIGNRLRTALAQRAFGGPMVTVSIGVASCEKKTQTSRELVEKADAALYQAKKKGKNRLVVWAGQPGSDDRRKARVPRPMVDERAPARVGRPEVSPPGPAVGANPKDAGSTPSIGGSAAGGRHQRTPGSDHDHNAHPLIARAR